MNAITWLSPAAPRSISDDDLCSDCKHCDYKAGELSRCREGWPGHFAASGPHEGYCVACPKFEPRTSFAYSPWRHGGWYVHDVRYPSGACGCVSRNYQDRKWRIACDSRPFAERPTFANRDEAARAEMAIAYAQWLQHDGCEDESLPPGCECDNTHEANNTVCRWCWAHGRRHWNDQEVSS